VAATTSPAARHLKHPTPSLLFLLPFLISILACAPPPPADLTVAHDAEPQSLDPALMTGLAEGRIAAALFEGLTRLDPETLEVLPGVAESWSVTGNGRIWTFHLRPGVSEAAGAYAAQGRPTTRRLPISEEV
jgi:ABC-type oligopeptide transport system substrate-binding subunit